MDLLCIVKFIVHVWLTYHFFKDVSAGPPSHSFCLPLVANNDFHDDLRTRFCSFGPNWLPKDLFQRNNQEVNPLVSIIIKIPNTAFHKSKDLTERDSS